MQSTSRKFHSCMFCSSGDEVSKKHIFGKSFSRAFPNQPLTKVPRTRNAGVDPKKYRGGGTKPLDKTSKSMCRQCNEDLGKEMAIITPKLVKLAKARTNLISKEDSRLALRYFQRIALLIDLETMAYDPSIMSESSDDLKYRQPYIQGPEVFTEDERHRFRNGEVLSDVGVFLSRYRGIKGSLYDMDLAPYIDLRSPRKNGKRQVHRKFIFSMPKLTYLLIIGRNGSVLNKKLQRFSDPDHEFRLDHKNPSYDKDILNDYAAQTIHLDGSFDSGHSRR